MPVPIGEGQQWLEGEERAWEALAGLSPREVSRRAVAVYHPPTSRYLLPFFGEEVAISLPEREIRGNSPGAEFLLEKLHYYSRLSILWYLIQAKDIPLSGNLVNPANPSDGLIFTRGSHVLPLEEVACKYAADASGFARRGKDFNGVPLTYGDASFRLLPFPRVPVILVLWTRDEEFPARASLLFDSTISLHLPPDIVWSTAMLSLLLVL